MSEHMREMHSRQGREKQVYSSTGVRLVAGCIILNQTRDKVLLVSSSKHNERWVLPKGGVEVDEMDFKETAKRETWEEAGVIGPLLRKLGVYVLKPWSKHPPEAHFYEMGTVELAEKYPEVNWRCRRWFSYHDAKFEFEKNGRPDFLSILDQSSICKDLGKQS